MKCKPEKEYWCVVPNQIPVPLLGIHFHSKPSGIPEQYIQFTFFHSFQCTVQCTVYSEN